jgi:hypothetical protein
MNFLRFLENFTNFFDLLHTPTTHDR